MAQKPLPPRLQQLADMGTLTLQRCRAHELGIPTVDLTRWARAGHLIQTGDGGYVICVPGPADEAPWAAARREHLLRARAVSEGLPGSYAVGLTAALAHDLRPLELPPRVALSRNPPFRSRRPAVESRPPWGRAARGAELDPTGLSVQPVPECIVETAASCGVLAGLVIGNRALSTKATMREDLVAAADSFGVRKGAADVRALVALADARIDRAIETLMFWTCHTAGIPVEPQAIIHDRAGEWVAQVDFLVKGTNVVIETDGVEKYRDRGDLRREKHRELDILAAGYVILRFSWQDLRYPDKVRARIMRAINLACQAA